MLKPVVSSRQQKSQATPLGEDILSLLKKQLTSSDTFGGGVTGAQQGAMKSMDKFIGARETPEQFMKLMGPLKEMFQLNTDKSAAQTRESFGATGNRMSRSAMKAEGATRNEGNLSLQAMLSQLFMGDQANLLGAIGQKQQMANQNIAPALDFGAMGIMPDQTMINDSTATTLFKGFNELLKSGTGVAKTIATGGMG